MSDFARAGSRHTSWPRISTRPPSGRSSPVAIDRVVVLPAPFGPTTPNIEPRGTVSVRSSTARWLPKFFVSSLSCMAGALAGPDGGVGGCSNRGTGGC